jgi:hypothetical protein
MLMEPKLNKLLMVKKLKFQNPLMEKHIKSGLYHHLHLKFKIQLDLQDMSEMGLQNK